MTLCGVYPAKDFNGAMRGNSNFARPMLPTYTLPGQKYLNTFPLYYCATCAKESYVLAHIMDFV